MAATAQLKQENDRSPRRSKVWIGVISALLGAGAGLLVGALAFEDDEVPPVVRPTATTLERVIDEPSEFRGQAVFISGQVREILTPRSFTVSSSLYSGRDLLVVSRVRLAAPTGSSSVRPLLEGDRVDVFGEVRPFDRSEFERELDVGLGREFDIFLGEDLDEREGDPAIQADRVTVRPRTTPIVEPGEAEEIADRPGEFYGDIVSVTGQVTDVRPSGALVIDDELVALTADFGERRPRKGERLRIVGPVRPFDPDQFRVEAMPDPDQPFLGELANRPAVIAQSIEIDEPNRDDAEATAELAEQALRINREIAQTAGRLVKNPQQSEDAPRRLEQLERRANDLANRVPDEAPRNQAVRQGLVESYNRAARASDRLQQFARSSNDRRALAAAREELRGAREGVRSLVDDLGGELSAKAQRGLGELAERVPAIPGAP